MEVTILETADGANRFEVRGPPVWECAKDRID